MNDMKWNTQVNLQGHLWLKCNLDSFFLWIECHLLAKFTKWILHFWGISYDVSEFSKKEKLETTQTYNLTYSLHHKYTHLKSL